jgi:hypothetical protein
MTYQQIIDALDAANGRRRTRTLSRCAIPQVLQEAIRNGIGGTTGGGVPNSYGYPASTTRLWAITIDSGIAVCAETVQANKVSPVPGGYRGERTLRARVEGNLGDYIILTTAEARRIVRDASDEERLRALGHRVSRQENGGAA